MTQDEFNQYKNLKKKFDELCWNYIEQRQTFDDPNYNIENDKNEWNFVDDYDVYDDEVHFLVDTNGYKYEGQRYIIRIKVEDILNN